MGTTLHTLTPNPGATKPRKRLGRGHGSGTHKTAGKGQKGQKARTGHHGIPKLGFEGGQTIMARRLPKRGFKNPFRRDIFAVNVGDIAARFASGSVIGLDELKDAGLVPRTTELIKVLAGGELSSPLAIKAHYFSAAAREKILFAKGSFEQIEKSQVEGAES
jgi:large subunit ribosomal protein L15